MKVVSQSVPNDVLKSIPFKGLDEINKIVNALSDGKKKLKIIACVLRNDGSGWRFVDETHGEIGHSHVNALSVTSDIDYVNLNFNFKAKNILSFVACPDETFAQKGYFIGSSVVDDKAQIRICRTPKPIEAYASYNGTTWVVSSSSGVTFGSFTSGVLKLNHENIPTSYNVSATGRGGKYNVQLGSVSNTFTEINFYDTVGNLVTTPTTDMKVFFSRIIPLATLDPATVIYPGGNIWCVGVFEI